MIQNDVTISQLITQMTEEMRRIGYSEATIWRYYIPLLSQFRKYYRITGRTTYSVDVTGEYVALFKKRLEDGEISYTSYGEKKFIGKRMNEFFLTGTLRVVSSRKGTSYTLSANSEQLLDRFLDYKQYAPQSTKDATWVVRRYLHHWEEKNLSLSEISCDEAKDFILICNDFCQEVN